jgi:hypothetical protein
MSPGSRSALARVSPREAALSPLGSFVDSLVQAFEDRRAGLKDAELDPAAAERFFGELYQRERERLLGTLRLTDPQLAAVQRERLRDEIDTFAHRVLVPAFARLSVAFTARERNDFFLLRGPGRVVERVAIVAGATVLGALVVWAPFIPLWSKHWVWVFGLGGLFGPELRRYLAWRGYGRALNDLVASADRELERLRNAYLLEEGDS